MIDYVYLLILRCILCMGIASFINHPVLFQGSPFNENSNMVKLYMYSTPSVHPQVFLYFLLVYMKLIFFWLLLTTNVMLALKNMPKAIS